MLQWGGFWMQDCRDGVWSFCTSFTLKIWHPNCCSVEKPSALSVRFWFYFYFIPCHSWGAISRGRTRIPTAKSWSAGFSSFITLVQSRSITSTSEKFTIPKAWLAASLCHLLWPFIMDSQQTYVTIRSVKHLVDHMWLKHRHMLSAQ